MTRVIRKRPTHAARSFRRLVLIGLVAGALLVPARATHAGATPEQKCAAGKNKTAGKYAACRENAEAQLATSGDTTKYGEAITKCGDKFATAWQALEDKAVAAGTACPSVGDAIGINGKVTATTDTVAALVAGGVRFKDNGDGTVTDHQTGLQWEKKVSPGGGATDPDDVDNIYNWTAGGGGDTFPDGTVFTDFLAKLNGASSDGITITGCLAGHCDWRLPTIVELQTILDPSLCGPSTSCIDPIFGPTIGDLYYSATTDAAIPTDAWVVAFYNGDVTYWFKHDFAGLYVRAVRAGS